MRRLLPELHWSSKSIFSPSFSTSDSNHYKFATFGVRASYFNYNRRVCHNRGAQENSVEFGMTSYYRSVHLEIEEVGWNNLVRANEDLTVLSFKIFDIRGRLHILEIVLDESYPLFPPAISADMPHLFMLKWSSNSRLTDVVDQFSKFVEEFHDFWCVMEGIDKSLMVVGPAQPSRATSFRHISVGNECVVVVNVNPENPLSLPESRFIGSVSNSSALRNLWRRNVRKWSEHKSFVENLSTVLGICIQGPPEVDMDHQQLECGICYGQYLPSDIELGTKSGSATDYTCDNTSCSKAFHSLCLADWLHSITTTRQSFNVLFGACPYCSEPVAVKINHRS